MATETRVSVLMVDDHAIVREGIAEVLSRSGQFEVVGQAAGGDEAVAQVRELRPDVVIMDILMPGKSGIEACREIVAVVPDTRVLMLTASNKQSAIVESVDAGAVGYLQKYSNREMLLSAVREAADGGFRVQGEAARLLLAGMGRDPAQIAPGDLDRLTAREREVLENVHPGNELCGYRSSPRQQSQVGPKRRVRHTAQNRSWQQAGDGCLGGTKRTAG